MPETVEGVVKVEGAWLRYVVEGSGMPALVIGSSIYYPRTFSQRLRKVLRMAFIDVRHFARNDGSLRPDRISLDTYLNDIEKLRARLGIKRAMLIGHSHHGNLALEYANRFPARVSHVVLIGSPPVDAERTHEAAQAYWQAHASDSRKAALRRNQKRVTTGDFDKLPPEQAYVARYVADGPRYWFDVAYDASHLWEGVPIDLDVVDVFRSFFSGGYELSWEAANVGVPVLVATGLHDYAVPPVLWTATLRGRPNLTYELFEQSGHTPQLEESERFDSTLLTWLARHSAATPTS